MATQVSLNSGAVASAGALALQTNGTTQAVSISTGQVATFAQDTLIQGVTVGRGAGAVATNTAIGSDSLRINSGGANNSSFGYQAGYSNIAGQNLVAIGYQAGYTSNANNNTFVGYYAGQGTTGTLNTFVGVNGVGYLVVAGTKNTIVGGFSGNQGGLNISGSSNYIVLSDGDGNPLISTNSTRSVALNGATPQTGTGITFPATDSPSSNANTLDDYEEGTWTPNQGSGLTLVGTFSSSGTYTKIGRMVFVTGQFNGSTSVAIPATDIICTNLPFTTAVKSLGALNTGTIVQPGTVTLFSGTSIYGSTTSAASNIYFSISYSI